MAIYATDNDLKAIDNLDDEERVEALYAYLVDGWNMEEVGTNVLCIDSDQPGRIVSSLTRAYGFSGSNGGRYRQHRQILTRKAMEDLVYNRLPWPSYENGCLQSGQFDRAVQQYVQECQKRQARNQAQPRPQYQPPQPSAWELEQRRREEEEQRRRLEEQRRQEEEERRRDAQQEQNKKTADSLVQQGRSALARNDIRGAYSALSRAHELNPTWQGNLLLAETCARASNSEQHAQDIIALLTEHFNGYAEKKHSMAPTADQYLWRAKAYLNQGNKNDACNDYFRAGDLYYVKKDYTKADQIYTEGREKTNYYSGVTPDAAFRVAFARNRGKSPLAKEDHQTCVAFYRKAIQSGQQRNYAAANMSWHLRMLGDYSEAIDAAQEAIDEGLNEEYVYNNLFHAQQDYEEWEDAEETLDEMKYQGYDHASKRRVFYDKWLKNLLVMDADRGLELIEQLKNEGYAYEPWLEGALLLAASYIDEDEETEAKKRASALLKKQLERDYSHMDALYQLATESEQDEDRVNYGIRYLRALPSCDKSKYMPRHTDARVVPYVADAVVLGARNLGRENLISEALPLASDWVKDIEEERRQLEAAKAEREHKEKADAERKAREAAEAEQRRRETEEQERLRKEAERVEKLRRKRAEEEMLMLLL